MIHTNRIVTVGEQESVVDRPIVLYRGDREVEIEFTLVGNEFMFSTEGNVIKSTNASHGQLVLNTPSGENMFSALAECHDGKVVFVVTKEMIDELIETGFYSFQVRLYDSEEMRSRVTIPPVMNGFDIRNPIAAEDETNVVDVGLVDYSRIVKDQSNEEIPTFDWNGNYNKTDWEHHDVITENKMNKIEDAIYTFNDKLLNSDMTWMKKIKDMETKHQNDVNTLNNKDKQLGDEIDEVNRTINNRIDKLEVDVNVGDVAWKNEIEERVIRELETVNEQLEYITKKIIYPHSSWESELLESFKSNTNIKMIGNFECNSMISFTNIIDSTIEVVGEIKVRRSNNSNDQLFVFNNCSELELVLNVDCNKAETISSEYYPMVSFINCENIVVTTSKFKNAPHTTLGFAKSKNCIIKDSNFINFYDSGLNIGEGSINCIVKNNSFSCPDGLMNYGSHALNIYSRGAHTFGHLVSGNNFYDIQSTAIQLTGRIDSDGNELLDVTECIIESNIINFFGHNGVKLDGTGKNIKINNNIFKNANKRPDGTVLNNNCYGIFTSGQAGRAYSVDAEGNYFEDCGQYALRFQADTGDIMGYINFKNNICINSPIYITHNSKVDTVNIDGNRIIQGSVLITNGLNTSNIRNINITNNLLKNYNENGYCIYFINNGCLRFTNNTIETLYVSKNPGYIGYLSSTNTIVENNNVINIGGSDNKIRTVTGIIETCIFNGNINMDLYNQNDITTRYIKDYIKII